MGQSRAPLSDLAEIASPRKEHISDTNHNDEDGVCVLVDGMFVNPGGWEKP